MNSLRILRYILLESCLDFLFAKLEAAVRTNPFHIVHNDDFALFLVLMLTVVSLHIHITQCMIFTAVGALVLPFLLSPGKVFICNPAFSLVGRCGK